MKKKPEKNSPMFSISDNMAQHAFYGSACSAKRSNLQMLVEQALNKNCSLPVIDLKSETDELLTNLMEERRKLRGGGQQ